MMFPPNSSSQFKKDADGAMFVIHPSKFATYRIILLLFVSLIPLLVFIFLIAFSIFSSAVFEDLQYVLLVIVVQIIFLGLFAFVWMRDGKKYIFSKDGLTVCFLWYRRNYSWYELKVKRLENYKKCTIIGYSEGAVFSTKEAKSTDFMSAPVRYEIKHMFVPLAPPFFIDFKEEKSAYSSSMIYQVEKADFLNQIKNLGVDLNL